MTYKGPISPCKDAQHHQSSGKCISKPQWDTTSHSRRRARMKKRKITTVHKDIKKLQLYIAGEEVNSVPVVLENILAVSQEVKHKVAKWLSNSTPRCIPKRNENICALQNLYMKAHSRVIYNNRKVETTKCLSTDLWINKMCFIHTMTYDHG